ncbi:O-methyltransferase [Virgibacillus sp. C22-A2]|uniref:tRNA 5-hydroxyuridine methyltransferase n=1 Tax=Virgibacillus tibetensis TaxID=3042313 RepID=A0ABU6KBH5_9BACI|nr:O-methyltransferase [Virgibacillus sp. C22-A2]
MEEYLTNYLQQGIPEQQQWVIDLEKQAMENKVPIMEPVSMNFLMQIIKISKPKKTLEIGTAIGYSALRMLEAYPETNITTIERDQQRYHQAIENITAQTKNDHVNAVLGDALEVLNDEFVKLHKSSFNLIFIDAAKGQYKRFFELVSPLLANDGIIVSDNVLFRGYVANPENAHPRHKQMVGKIRLYNEWLTNHPDFTTSIVPIGDGVAISVKNS